MRSDSEEFTVKIVRSNRKSYSLRFEGGILTVRAPLSATEEDVRKVIDQNRARLYEIYKNEQKNDALKPFTKEELSQMKKYAELVFPDFVSIWAARLGVSYGRITIRSQVSRWGSCTRNGNISLNCLLALAPREVQMGVIVHELCHRKQMNHSDAFWHEVYRAFPNYDSCRKWLLTEGDILIRRRRKS